MVFTERQEGTTRGDTKDAWIRENSAACVFRVLNNELSVSRREISEGNMAEERLKDGDAVLLEDDVAVNMADEARKFQRNYDFYLEQLKKNGHLKNLALESELLADYAQLESFDLDPDAFREETAELWSRVKTLPEKT